MIPLADYDPRRKVPSSGETVYEARERLKSWSEQLRLQAMSKVKQLICGGMSESAAEDVVYGQWFGPARFPRSKAGVVVNRSTLEDVLRAGPVDEIH